MIAARAAAKGERTSPKPIDCATNSRQWNPSGRQSSGDDLEARLDEPKQNPPDGGFFRAATVTS